MRTVLALVALGMVIAPPVVPSEAVERLTPSPSTGVYVDRIEEDEAGWNCQTMGNLRCGKGVA